jgi:acyl-CoA synthetase (AMP-forming)/AMP-acid ligase II
MYINKFYYINREASFGTGNTEEVFMVVLPMFHAYGFMCQLISINIGSKAVVIKQFEEELFLRSIQNYKVRI